MKTVKILSIDGGGIRGIIPAMVLSKLEEMTKKYTYQMFDMIAGTSTGGILALGLVKPSDKDATKPAYGAADMAELYAHEGKHIFHSNLWHRIESLEGLREEKYPSTGIEAVLKNYFGDSKLSNALTDVLITSYEVESRNPFFFKSSKLHDPSKSEPDYYMWQVARSTSAAPTYFEVFKLQTQTPVDYYSLIDGGVFANNPAMCAYAEGRKLYGEDADFVMVSLGTGELTKRYPYEEVKDWGLVNWAKPILDVVFDGVSKTVNYQLDKLLPKEKYHRFQADLSKLGKEHMDDASESNIHGLKLVAEELVTELEKSGALDDLCKSLV